MKPWIFRFQTALLDWERSIHGRPYPYVWPFFRLIGGWAFESNGRKYGWWPGKHFGFRHTDYYDHFHRTVV